MGFSHWNLRAVLLGGMVSVSIGCVAPTSSETGSGSTGGKADGTADFTSVFVDRWGEPESFDVNSTRTVDIHVVSADRVDDEPTGSLHVESTELRLLVEPDAVVDLAIGTDFPDTNVGFELAYRTLDEPDALFHVIEPPPTATERGGYWIGARLDHVFGRVTGTWRPGEGLEPWDVFGHTLIDAAPATTTGTAYEHLPAGVPLEYRVRAVPLWSPGDLDGLVFSAEVAAVTIEPNHRVRRTDAMTGDDGSLIARGYDEWDEVVLEATIVRDDSGMHTELTATYDDGSGEPGASSWQTLRLVLGPDADGRPIVVEQSGELSEQVVLLLYTLQLELTRNADAEAPVQAEPMLCVTAAISCYIVASVATLPLQALNLLFPGVGVVAHAWAAGLAGGVCAAATCTVLVSPAWR